MVDFICKGYLELSGRVERVLQNEKFLPAVGFGARAFRLRSEDATTELQPRTVDSLTPSCRKFEIWFRRVESFSFLNFWMLKSCRNFECSERSKVWKLGDFETVDYLSSLSNLRQRFWRVRRFDSSGISKIWKQSLSKVRTQSFQKAFDVERSEISTSNALSFQKAFYVERSELSKSVRRRTLWAFKKRSTSNAFWKLRAFDVERFLKALRSNLRQRLLSNLWNLRAVEPLNASKSLTKVR